MGTTTHALIDRHACLVDRTETEIVPRGWHPILDLLFHDMEEALSAHPGIKLDIQDVKEKRGALRVHVEAAKGEATKAALDDVHQLIVTAERRSSRTCQVCGAMGQRRHGTRVATLCDTHHRQLLPNDQDGLVGFESLNQSDASVDAISGPAEIIDEEHERAPGVLVGGGVKLSARRGSFRLYHTRAVADALGQPAELDENAFMPDRPETEHELRLAAILERGEAGTWRDLAKPNSTCLDRLDTLDAVAPHMAEVTALVRRHVQAAFTIGLHIQVPPLMLLGEPGMGKSWYLARLGEALGLPVGTYPMSASTLGEGLQGNNPLWRNAGPGLVARTLLQERVANP